MMAVSVQTEPQTWAGIGAIQVSLGLSLGRRRMPLDLFVSSIALDKEGGASDS